MRQLCRGFAAAALLCGTAAIAAEKPVTFAQPTPRKAPVIIAPPPPEVLAEAIRAEMDAYARRLDACTRLQQIAIETGDDALLATVEELERQAGAMYQARVARLGCSPKQPPKPAAAREERLTGAVNPLAVQPPVPLQGVQR